MAEAKRNLKAILAADVAGYSRLMGDDERATMGRMIFRSTRTMPRRTKFISLMMVIALAGASACAWIEQQTGVSTGAQTGAAVGAAAGGLITAAARADTGWIVAAAVLGAVAGVVVGDYLTREDKMMAGKTANDALETQPTGNTSTWQNPDSGNSGSVTVTDTYQQADGTPCRSFTQTIAAGDRTESGVGTACRAADGTWRIMG